MAILARRPTTSTFTPAPEGLHHVVCVDVADLGVMTSAFGDKHKVRIYWQLAETDERGRRFDVRKLYTLSLHKRAALRKDLESWRGQKFTEAELADGFNLEKLLGANATVQIVHDLGDDNTVWANVSVVLPAPKGVKKLFPLNFTRHQDRAPRQGVA